MALYIVFAEIIAINLCDTAALFDIPQFTAGLFENMLFIAARFSVDDDFSRGIDMYVLRQHWV